jgi:alkanesulfonate monooxygenase SsuD/methylene tetrahydromethanopterin reductase-like flavin-dependent oxidoreductase (luciferase family)
MKVGLFDHVDRSDRPLATQFGERLKFIAAADEAGFYAYHVAEHHGSPLNMVPVPGIWLGAVARATKRIRLGPMVYLLPLASPLRMIEEICMLDHLSNGRLEVGVGRGVSPFELGFHKIDHERSRDLFVDAFDCIRAGLTSDPFTYASENFSYSDVPMPLRPLQQPYPAFWYGSSNVVGSTWAGEQGLHFTTNGDTRRARTNIEAFKLALGKRGGPVQPKAEFPGGAAIGVLRHIVVADSDERANEIARPAYDHHYANINYLRRLNAENELARRLHIPTTASFEESIAEGIVIVGSPETVYANLALQIDELGINYLLAYLFFGTMQLTDALRSMQLFRRDVMPRIAHL